MKYQSLISEKNNKNIKGDNMHEKANLIYGKIKKNISE